MRMNGLPTTMSMGNQDTLDKEMMVEHSHQIETPAVCQSYGLDIDEAAANIEEIRELTDTTIEHMLQHEGSLTTVVDNDAVLRIHRLDEY